MTFDDFLVGFAAADKQVSFNPDRKVFSLNALSVQTQHGGIAGEARTNYVFKYYDTNGDKKIDKTELRNLVIDKLKTAEKSNRSPPAAKVNDELADIYQKLGVSSGQPLTFEQLKSGIGNLSIRGTSSLFRSNISLKKIEKMVYSPITECFSANGTVGQNNSARCGNCAKKQYHISSHSYTLTKKGLLSNPNDIDNDDTKRVSREVRR